MKELDKFPFDHVVDCIQKIVWIDCSETGQMGRYGSSHVVNKFYPGYTGKIVSREHLETLKNRDYK
jgi:hypothetical protein